MFTLMKSTKVQLTSIVASAIYISALLLVQYYDQTYAEPVLTVQKIDSVSDKLASKVEVGMHINGFPSFSFSKNKFSIDAIVWFKFPKGTIDLATLEKFTLQNSEVLGDVHVVHKTSPIIKLIGDEVLVSYYIQARFMTYLKFKRFPLGDHRLNIILQNRSVTARELNFISEKTNLTLSEDILVDDWKAINTHASTGYVNAVFKKDNPAMSINYPCAVFTIDFTSIGARSLFTLYFPLFVVFFIGLLSLTIGLFNFSRLGIIASSLPMLVLFRMVIEGVSPAVGYATHIDFTFYTLVFLSLLILLLQMYIVLESSKIADMDDSATKDKRTNTLETINNSAFFGILILLIILMTYNFLR